jgi:hypothetical protein
MRRPTRLPLALLALLALFAAAPSARAAAVAAPEPRLLSSDASGASFVVEVPEPRFSTVTAPNGTWQRMDVSGWSWDAKPGEPLLPAAGFWLAVPEGARVTLDAQGEDARVYENVRLLPQQELPRAESAPGQNMVEPGPSLARPIRENPEVYGRVGEGPAPAATLDGIAGLRSQRVARVTVRPAAYDPSTGRVRVWSRVRVTLAFEGGRASTGAFGELGTGALGTGALGGTLAESPPFEQLYQSMLLNYESGRAWRIDLGANSERRRGLSTSATGGVSGTLGAREDFTASPNWLRLEVANKGVYRLTPSDFAAAGIAVSSVDPRTLRVFVRPGVPLLGEYDPPAGWLSEVAANVAGESDGTFDTSDYLLFFALGSSAWKDEFTSPGDSLFFNHPYDTKNVYWVTWGGGFADPPRRWATRAVAPERVDAFETPDVPARVHLERDNDYRPDLQEGGAFHARVNTFWEKWVWQIVTDRSGTVPFLFTTPGADITKPARLFARTWGNSRESFGQPLIRDHHLNLAVNDVAMAERAFYGLFRQDFDTTFALRPTNNRVTLTCRFVPDSTNAGRQDQVAMMWFDVHYARKLTPVGDVMDFRSPDTTSAIGYGVGPFTQTAGFLLLDTSDMLSPVQLVGMVERDTTGGKAVYFHDDGGARKHYLALTASGIRRPDAITRPVIDDLKSPTNGADYVVLTYDGFVQPAQSLAAFRATELPGFTSPRTRVVKVSDVYNWYSGGRVDPTAIRNFFYDAIKNVGWSPAPSYACFLGDASFDFKNIYRLAPAGQPAALVPSYPNGWQTRQFMMDDWLVDLDLGIAEPYPGGPPPGYPDSIYYDLPDLVVGRIPAATLTEARYLVEQKGIPYERTPSFGEWRQRALFVADDTTQFSPNNPENRDPVYLQHMEETENITALYLAPQIETRKILELDYPFIGSSTEKPAVNAAVKAAVNEGVVLWNYIGHGNPFKMADENAFILSDVDALQNATAPTLLVAASCDLGKFDDAVITGLGEALFKSRTGGAIATISATDIAFAFSNIALAKELYLRLNEKNESGFAYPLGEVLLLAKYRRFQLAVNDLKYVLLGDPGMRLGFPREDVRMTLTRVSDGAPVDTLRRGEQVRVQGEIHSSHDPGTLALDAGFNGTVNLLVTDAPPRDTVLSRQGNLAYTHDPGAVFRGQSTVSGGRFEATFFVPLEALTGPNAKVFAYATNGATDGGGAVIRNVVTGVPTTVDTVGPTIAMAFASGTTKVGPTETLRIVVRDESGVNITGHTIPNALYLTIDGDARYDLTKGFRYDLGSYQQGTVEFELPGLDPGPHSIRVSAADNYAAGVLARRNRTTATIDFEVVAAEDFTLGRVYNFPNPFKGAGGTSFVLTGLSEPADVVVQVYTVSGSLVRRIDTSGGPGQIQLAWDGRDERGDRLANGAYLYQVEAQGRTSGKLVRYQGRAALVE